MSSELRVNSSTNRSGLGTITYTDSGPIVSGVGTFSNGLTVDGTQTNVKSLKLTGDNYNANWFKTTNKLRFNDNAKATFGTSDDLQLYHTGNHSRILESGVGKLQLGSDTQVEILNGAFSVPMAQFNPGGSVVLRHNTTTRLETTSSGISVTGNVVATTFAGNGDFVDIDVDGQTNLDNVDVVGIITVSTTNQYHGYKLSNGSNLVGELVGLSGSNDTGALALWSGGSKYVQLSAVGGSFLTGGSLGIGTDNPNNPLTVHGSGNHIFLKDTATSNILQIRHASGVAEFNTYGTGGARRDYVFNQYSTEVLRIASNSNITQTIDSDGDGFTITAGDMKPMLTGNSNRSAHNNTIFGISGKWNNTEIGRIAFEAGPDTTNKDDGKIRFYTRPSGGALTKRFEIVDDGKITVAAGSDIRFTNGTWTGEVAGKIQHNSNNLYIQGGTGGIRFRHASSGVNQFSMTNGGNFEITNGDLVVAAGHGIDFSATSDANGTMASELFSDYERGTHSFSVTSSSTNPTVSISSNHSKLFYTKVGDMVHVTGELRWTISSHGTGHLRISLPFTSDSTTSSNSQGTAQTWNVDWKYGRSDAEYLLSEVLPGANYMIFRIACNNSLNEPYLSCGSNYQKTANSGYGVEYQVSIWYRTA